MLGTDHEELAHEVLGRVRHALPQVVRQMILHRDPRLDLVEDRGAAQQNVHDHPDAPQVASRVVASVRLARLQHLRRKVLRRAAKRRRDLLLADKLGEPKIGDLDGGWGGRRRGAFCVRRALEQDVLRLQVAVHNVPALAHDAARIGLTARAVIDEIVEELAAVDQLHDEADLALVLKNVVELDDVRMREVLEDARLGQNLRLHLIDLNARLASQLTKELLLLHDLHCEVPPRSSVHHLFHNSERSPPELAHLIVVARRAVQLGRNHRRGRQGRRRGTQVLEEELIVVGPGGVEHRDRVAILQQLTAVLAYQSAVDIRPVAAQVVQIDVPVFVRAADLAVLAASCTAGEWESSGRGGGGAAKRRRSQDQRWEGPGRAC
eukprot:scaffold57831_cov72-Phaeocystis_antarctica.AAC.6